MTVEDVHTIADLARLAGVSKSTVSRALNDSPLISVETKARVRTLAREHGFEIDVRAQRLSLRQSGAVAFVAYGWESDNVVPDAFKLGIMSGVSAGLSHHDYDLLVINVAPGDDGWPRRYLQAGRADGFIVLNPWCNQRQLKTLIAADAPFVLWGAPSRTNAYCSVGGDSLTGGRLATEHLVRRGRRRVAFIGGPARDQEVQDRLGGYELALADAGLEVDRALIAYGDYSEESARDAMIALLERAPDLDAVFVGSDAMAIAALEVLRGHGRSVPGDVGLVGYDDIPLARHVTPALTTIRQDAVLAGRLLADSIVQHLRTGAITNVSIPAELVVRESS